METADRPRGHQQASMELITRALYEVSNATQRAAMVKAVSFPEGVEIKLRVVNCAGSKYLDFGKSLEILNIGFSRTGIQFQFDGDGDTCNPEEMQKISAFCTSSTVLKSVCPENALSPISNRLNYYEGLLLLVIDAAGYVGGQADLGFLKDNPWVMVQVSSLPEVSPIMYPGTPVQFQNRGIVLNREIGHALGLHHTFENGCSFPGHYIPDTPYEGIPLISLPEYWPTLECCTQRPTDQCSPRPTCPEGTGNNFDNIMDYSPDSCNKKFTRDQIAAMQATLLDKRPQWLGISSQPSIGDLAIVHDLVEGSNKIEGNIGDSTDVPIPWSRISFCPKDSIWMKQYQYQYNPGVLGQPRKLVYRINVPESTENVLIKQCELSTGGAEVSLTYLECRTQGSFEDCECRVFQCAPGIETALDPNYLNSEQPLENINSYLILSNDLYASNELSFTMDIVLELRQVQPPPVPASSPPPSPMRFPPPISPPSPSQEISGLLEGIYAFGPIKGSCRGRHISAKPGKRCRTRVRMTNFKQSSSNSTSLMWQLTKHGQLKSVAASRSGCKSEYLAAPRSGAKLGGRYWRWNIKVVERDHNEKGVHIVSESRKGRPSYLRVNSDCSLTFSSSPKDQSEFEALDYSFLSR